MVGLAFQCYTSRRKKFYYKGTWKGVNQDIALFLLCLNVMSHLLFPYNSPRSWCYTSCWCFCREKQTNSTMKVEACGSQWVAWGSEWNRYSIKRFFSCHAPASASGTKNRTLISDCVMTALGRSGAFAVGYVISYFMADSFALSVDRLMIPDHPRKV